jgi:AcrR family transcriptional regulator
MGASRGSVKGERVYDASRRQEQARRQHAATLDIARGRFLANGYAGTTVESIAAAAGVSAATIYKSYGGKVGLVRALCDRALAGTHPVPAEVRSNALRSMTDAGAIVDAWGRLAAEVSPEVSPLLLLLRDVAASDHEAVALRDEVEATRLRRMADNARHLLATGQLRPGTTPAEVRDVLWTCSSPELYELLVVRRGWTRSRFGRFVADTIRGSLL